MTHLEVMAKMQALGYRLALHPDGLMVEGIGRLDPELRALGREHRVGILEILKTDQRDLAEERAGILEYEAGLPRVEAERRAGL